MRKKLILSDGARERELQLVGRIVVGRDPACEVSHDDSLLSRRHAEFLTVGDAVTVRDLGSRNGVFVNGTRAAEHRLEAGDVVQIGPLRARYVIDGAPSSIVPEDMDVERTAIFRRPVDMPVPPETSESVGTPAVIAAVPAVNFDSVTEFDSEEEEVTRLVPAPRMPKPAPAVAAPAALPAPPAAPAPSAVVDSDDEITQFTRAPRFSIPPAAPAPSSVPATSAAPPPAPLHELQQTRTVRTAQTNAAVPASSGGFVYFAVGTLAFIVLAASAPFVAAASTTALVVPVAVAILGTILVGALINRRITRALAAVERKGI